MTTAYSVSCSDKEATAFRKGWSQAFGTIQGGIYLVPSETQGIVIQHYPRFRISCILPATKRKLKLSFTKDEWKSKEFEFSTPDILLSQCITIAGNRHLYCIKLEHYGCNCITCKPNLHSVYCHCGECLKTRLDGRISNHFNLFSCKKTTVDFMSGSNINNNIITSPIVFANVYNDGKICFGQQRIPGNLRAANNNFWGSTFNNDFKYATFKHRWCVNKSAHYYGPHWIVKKNHAGNCRKLISHICGCKCLDKNKHHFTCGGCFCVCSCSCCLGACQCVCNCECCRRVCGCSCDCDYNDEFADFIQTAFSTVPGKFHSLIHVDVTGSNWISVAQKIDGIFISSEPKLLQKVNPNFHRILIDSKVVIGLGRIIADNEWEITLENNKVLLLDDKEVKIL